MKINKLLVKKQQLGVRELCTPFVKEHYQIVQTKH